MLFFLILGLLLGGAAVIFALQNVAIVTVSFFDWQMQGSLSLIILFALAAGVLVCILVSIPEVIKSQIEYSRFRKENKKLITENENYKRILGDAGEAGDITRITHVKLVENKTSSSTTS